MMNTPAPFTAQDANQLIALFSAGRYAELESRCIALTQRHPNVGFIWKVLGVVHMLQNKDGTPALSKAAELMPQDAETWSNLGNAQRAQGQLQAAEDCYRRAISLEPEQASHHYNLGIALSEQDKKQEAITVYRHALALNPSFPDAHFNLGTVLQALREFDAAKSSYQQAIKIQPAHARAWCNLGAIQARQGLLDDALISLRQALKLDPGLADAHHNLGNVHKDALRMVQGAQAFAEAIRLQPNHVDAHHGLGHVFIKLRQYRNAIASLDRAIQLDPCHVDSWIDMGNVRKEMGELREALNCFERADHFDPTRLDVLGNWLMLSNYTPSISREQCLERARLYGQRVSALAKPLPGLHATLEENKVMTVGLVSGDLRRHPVGYFLDTVLQALHAQSAGHIQLIGYPTQPISDALTQRIRACCSDWHPLTGLDDADAAQRIADDKVDILIDMAGHTEHNRLPMFAWRPAPVQVSWLGYFATTGVKEIDHVLSDPWTTPPELQKEFTERLWLLPDTRMCFTPPESSVQVSELPAQTTGHITFGCFNNLTKVNDEVLALWTAIVQRTPGSKLFLKAPQLDDHQMHEQTVRRLESLGLNAKQFVLEGHSPRDEYLRSYDRVDIGLDPFPFTGGTTTAESLWMGVPVLTLRGDTMVGRQGVSMMANVGLVDWIADDKQDYVEKACAFACDFAALAELRSRLRDQALASPLFDAPRFARHLHAALRDMWRQHCTNVLRNSD